MNNCTVAFITIIIISLKVLFVQYTKSNLRYNVLITRDRIVVRVSIFYLNKIFLNSWKTKLKIIILKGTFMQQCLNRHYGNSLFDYKDSSANIDTFLKYNSIPIHLFKFEKSTELKESKRLQKMHNLNQLYFKQNIYSPSTSVTIFISSNEYLAQILVEVKRFTWFLDN